MSSSSVSCGFNSNCTGVHDDRCWDSGETNRFRRYPERICERGTCSRSGFLCESCDKCLCAGHPCSCGLHCMWDPNCSWEPKYLCQENRAYCDKHFHMHQQYCGKGYFEDEVMVVEERAA